ncbi:MAG: hypothetical protein Q8K64_16745 [Sediminibacterium sp.]|nr:hypothetical protein [Sediminibacterium sp.]
MKNVCTILILFIICFNEGLWAQKQRPKTKAPVHYSKSTKSKKKPTYKKRKKYHSHRSKKIKQGSEFVFTNEKGSVVVKLPKAKLKTYKLIIYDTDLNQLFTIQKIPETELILEKGNFLHEGWFGYELFEEGKLLEKKKFLISKN